jgi:methyl-accepting chemotaxis protein
MAKNVDLANNPALDPEERQRQLEGKSDNDEEPGRTARTNYFVDRNFQFRFASLGVMSLLVFLGVTSLIFYWGLGTVESIPVREQVTSILTDILPYIGPAILLVLVPFGVYYLLLSHRICGPVRRISDSLQRIRNGERYFTLSVRSTDYLLSVADEINQLLESLRTRERKLERVSTKVSNLQQDLEDLDEDADLADIEPLTEACESIQDTLNDLQTPSSPSPDTNSNEEE